MGKWDIKSRYKFDFKPGFPETVGYEIVSDGKCLAFTEDFDIAFRIIHEHKAVAKALPILRDMANSMQLQKEYFERRFPKEFRGWEKAHPELAEQLSIFGIMVNYAENDTVLTLAEGMDG